MSKVINLIEFKVLYNIISLDLQYKLAYRSYFMNKSIKSTFF